VHEKKGLAKYMRTRSYGENYPEDWGAEEKRIAEAVTRLNELKSRGVDTIVDLTVIDLGR
jgi:phosphotriesterase-related protein